MSDVIKFVNQLVDETSPPEDAPRLEMQEGGLVELRKILEKFKGKYPGLQLSIPIDTRKPTTPKIRINTEPQYKKFLEGKKKGFSINEIDELEKALSKYSKILSPKIAKSLEEKQKVLQEGRKKFAVKGKFGDRAEVKKQVNKIIEEIANGKRPLRDASRLFRGELIDTKLASKNFLTIDTRTKKPLYLSDKNFKILKEEIAPKLRSINARLKQGAASKEILEQLPNLTVNSFDSFYKKNPPIYNKLEIPRTLGDKVADMLNRHSVLGGNKFETISGNSFKDFKIKDLNKGDILTNEKIDNLIAKGDARFKEFKKVQNQVSKLKKTKYINPVSKKETTLFKALQEATGDIFPIHIDHIKGVKDEPLRFFQPLLSKTNIGKDAAMTVDELKKIGARRVLPGKQYAQGAVIDFKKQVNDLKKFADRKILQTAASGFEKPKRPSEILRAVPARDVVRKTTQSSGPTLGINLGFGPLLKTAGEVLGSPAAALAFATMTVKDNLEKGESLPAAVADKMVGLELLAPGAISRFAPGVMKGVLGLGRVARAFTPVGLGITAAGMAKDVYREYKRREALSDEDRLKEDLEAQEKFDEMMVGAAEGGLIPPKSGKTPHGDKGLASLADYDMTNTEFINGRY